MDRGSGLITAAVLATAVLFAVGFALGCGKDGPHADPVVGRGSTVVVAVESEHDVLPNVLDLDFLTFLPLAKRNAEGELEGRLAESWEPSADYREWTIHLRTDVYWEDGTQVTAHDVKFTLDLLDHPDREYPGFESVVVDDATLSIRPPNAMLFLDDIVYYPRHLLEGLDPGEFWSWDFWFQPVGNGPYRFVRYVPETLIEFEASPDYYGPQPRIERVIVKFVGKAELTELLAGTADIVEGNPSQISLIENDPRFRVYREIRPAARAIYWKNDHPVFLDPEVRRALTLAIDRPQLARVLHLPPDIPITDGPLTLRQLYRGEHAAPLPYDPDAARRLLRAAGWTDADGDDLLERDGREFRFTASVRPGNGLEELAVYVQDYLRRVGVQMEIEILEGAVIWEKQFSGDFEALFTIQQNGVHAHVRDFGRGNNTGYESQEGFELIDQMAATADPDERDRLHLELATLFRQELPVTRLLPWDWTTFAHRRIQGSSSPLGSTIDPFGTYMDELWVEED